MCPSRLSSGSNPLVSVVIPAYKAVGFLDECLASIECQTFRNLEIIVVDDASPDDTMSIIERHRLADSRIRAVPLAHNMGTLGARKQGVLASSGDYVMLVDQDDALVGDAIERCVAYASGHPADIYHFSVKVIAENDDARRAAAGMQAFLTPPPRRLEGDDILRVQLMGSGGYDWHVHHKLYEGQFARSCYELATDERLILSDDIYMCFIMASKACIYEAIPDSAWYLYHLGRGETYGKKLDLDSFERLASAEGKALRLARRFVGGESAPSRGDWSDRLDDLRDRLVFHTMNEWMDSLPDELKERSAAIALRHYPADAVSGEIYRFVRDFAYAYLQEGDKDSPTAKEFKRRALDYLYLARLAEEDSSFSEKNERYRAMKDIALCHLNDGGLLEPSGMSSHDINDDAERDCPFRGLIARLMRTRLMAFVTPRDR